MKTITAAQRDELERVAIRPSFGRDANAGWQSVSIRHRPFPDLAVEERLTVLAQIGQVFRDLAAQTDEERLAIAEQELAA